MGARSGQVYLAVEEFFEDEDVVVTVPTQAVRRTLVISDPLELPAPEQVPATPNVFTPNRLVINFQVEEGEGGTIVQRFNPPMVLRVGITEAERDLVAEGHELKLAFWDGSRWVVFTKEKHQFELHSEFAIALIRHWDDATMAWGR